MCDDKELLINVIQQSAYLIYPRCEADAEVELTKIEAMGRLCYNSKMSKGRDERDNFLRGLVKKGHHSVIEHGSISFILTTSRAVSHQLVRHRIGIAISQQSQRYIDLSKNPVDVIAPIPVIDDENVYNKWYNSVEEDIKTYRYLRDSGLEPQRARSVLPNCVATKIGITCNMREMLHIIKLRTSNGADPAIRDLISKVEVIAKIIFNPIFDN